MQYVVHPSRGITSDEILWVVFVTAIIIRDSVIKLPSGMIPMGGEMPNGVTRHQRRHCHTPSRYKIKNTIAPRNATP